MPYPALEEASAEAIERWLAREIRRMTRLIAADRAKGRRSPVDLAFRGIWLGEKFGYQQLLREIKRAKSNQEK